MGWTIFLGIVLVLIGLVMLFRPSFWWELTESWKNGTASEPSDFYLKVTRIGGAVFLVVGAAGAILALVLK